MYLLFGKILQQSLLILDVEIIQVRCKNYCTMLQARLPTPKLNSNNNQQSSQLSKFTNAVGRSRSSVSLAYLSSKLQQIEKSGPIKQIKQFTRVQSAFKKKHQQTAINSVSRVVNSKGKLHLGKIAKPGLILNSESRNNPWAKPNPIGQNIINKKGLMDMVNMGMIPRNADFTDLLNHKYEEIIKQPVKQETHQIASKESDNFFPTNPGFVQEIQQKVIEMGKTEEQLKKSNDAVEKKIRKKVKKSSKSKKQELAFVIPPEPVILQVVNQRVLKNEKYLEQLKKVRKTGDELPFLFFVKKVQQFAEKYNLKKFQIRLTLDETRKLSDLLIRQQILNAKALGICLAVKGSLNKRVYEVARMFAIRFKFKKSRRDLLKIENIKRYFRIKKFYVQMTKKRCDLLKFKLGSFAERQRRFIEEGKQTNGSNENFRVQIHLLPTSIGDYEQQKSYYKIDCRNNIQLTRIFSQEPQNLVILTEQQNSDFSYWLSLVNKIPGYHPNISIIPTNLRSYKVTTIDSIYYGISPEVIQKVRSLCGKKGESCVYPSSFKGTLVKICQAFNAKLYSASFYQPYLDKLLEEEDEDHVDLKIFEEYLNQMPAGSSQKISLASEVEQTSRSVSNVSLQIIKSHINLNSRASAKNYTQAQIKHVLTKAKTKQLNLYQISGEHFSNKLVIKRDILLAFKQDTPYSIIFQPQTSEAEFLKRLTQNILEFKNVNKWVLKIGTAQRFSRGLAFLQTDSLKILKEKKKKSYLSEADLHEVASIMKIILLDKLQIPQSSLHESSDYLSKFLKLGGYVEAVLTEASTECIFGKISVTGSFEILGTFSKIYTDEVVNCAGLYPSQNLTTSHFEAVKQIVSLIYAEHQLFGYITVELLIDRRTQKHYFIDMQFTLEQYSSLHFMYRSIFNSLKSQAHQSLTILRKLSKKQEALPPNSKIMGSKAKINNALEMLNNSDNKSKSEQDKQAIRLEFPRQIVYIPFIDNNGNVHNTFEDFNDACQEKNLMLLNFESGEGMKFLYLNLKEQKPDVLSLLVMSRSQRRALKYALDGLNFLTESGEKTNKFDKKVERRNYDCLYIHDIIWKLREIKKMKDSEAHTNTSNALDKEQASQFQPVP